MSLAAAGMDPETVILSEVSQREISYDVPYMQNLEKKLYRWTYLQNRNRLPYLENELTVTSGEMWREGIVREFGVDMYTRPCLKQITNKDLLHSTGNPAQCYVAVWMEGEFGGEWIHVYVWLSPFAVHLKVQHDC